MVRRSRDESAWRETGAGQTADVPPPEASLLNIDVRRGQAATPPRQDTTTDQDAASNDGVVGYWDCLRKGRRFPSRSDIDQEVVGRRWPNSLIVSCEGGLHQIETRLSGPNPCPTADGPIEGDEGSECSTMVAEWVVGLSREVARLGRPLQNTDDFPSSDGFVRFRTVALPLSDNERDIDHVLCEVNQMPGSAGRRLAAH
jgi:hypothetical protein